MSLILFLLGLQQIGVGEVLTDELAVKKDLVTSAILPYRNDYLLFDRRIIFQFSFKFKLLASKQDPTEMSGLFFAYTQHSYWKQGDGDVGNANPYIYSNYEPEIYYVIPYMKNHIEGIWVGFDHQSDGLGRQFDPLHREWNRYYVQPTFYAFDRHLKVRERLWYADVSARYNHDIVKFIGYSETNVSTDIGAKYWVPKIEITAYKGTGPGLRDLSFMFESHFAILQHESWSLTSPLHLYAQWYKGYGESLRTYDKKTNRFRMGISTLF